MNKTIDTFENLMTFKDEHEWLDFKENWFSKDEIGEYISALSNGAALCGKEFGYIVWGIRDNTKEIVGTTINLDKDIDGEPYKHYLARKLKPSIAMILEKAMQIFFMKFRNEKNYDYTNIEKLEETIQKIKRNANVDLALDSLMVELCKI